MWNLFLLRWTFVLIFHLIFSLTFLSLYRFGKRENDIGLVVVFLYREWRFSLMACMLGCCRSCSTRCSKPGWMGHEVVERGKGEGTKPNGPKTGFSLSELSPQLPPVPLPTWCFKASSQWRTTQNGRENSCPYFDILDESSDKWLHFVYVGENIKSFTSFFLSWPTRCGQVFLKIRDKTSIYTPTNTLENSKITKNVSFYDMFA